MNSTNIYIYIWIKQNVWHNYHGHETLLLFDLIVVVGFVFFWFLYLCSLNIACVCKWSVYYILTYFIFPNANLKGVSILVDFVVVVLFKLCGLIFLYA